MQTRTLGQQGLTTSAIGYGSMGISVAYGLVTNEKASLRSRKRTPWASRSSTLPRGTAGVRTSGSSAAP